MLTALSFACLALAALPAILFLRNLREYRPLRAATTGSGGELPRVSVLIPARDEATVIEAAVDAALANVGVDLEVVVLDDGSTDTTADLVRAISARDPRVRLEQAPALPEGWCGKQHACARLAALATRPVLVFLDADVRLARDALVRMARFLDESGAALVSGFPRQETGGLAEQTVIPLIHFLLLGFLPIRRMRANRSPGMAAGCGQLFMTKRAAYDQVGGHSAIRTTLHDGIKLPRAYRQAGLATDLFDATDVATCRMYRSAGALWWGLAKNATEALATPRLIVPATILLFGGQVLPLLLLLGAGNLQLTPAAFVAAALATTASYIPRVVGVFRFRQSPVGALLHPLGVLTLLAIQWYALARDTLGRPATWKGRPYPARTG